jgi:ubiquinone/menaquinone biosynthesis C-methylase UbiE
MSRNLQSKKIFAWAIFILFVVGFFYGPVGATTGTVLGAWFVGTQRVWRGFQWMMVLALIFGLPHVLWHLPQDGASAALIYAGWAIVAMVLGIVPFTLYRIASPRLPGWIATLPLPVFVVALGAVERGWLPAGAAPLARAGNDMLLAHVAAAVGTGAPEFITLWFAATLVWTWNQEFRAAKIRVGAILCAAVCAAAIGYEAVSRLGGKPIATSTANEWLDTICLALAAVLTLWALVCDRKKSGYRLSAETMRNLRSPASGEQLQLVGDGRSQVLASASGERFPVRDGMADLRRPEDMTGDNKKYNQLYEMIGGFYDDVQRVVSPMIGIDRDAYVMSYLGLLEVKAGDSVLETSVGTGLNFKYLPQGVKLTGIDLSPEMLVNCRANLARWGLDANLFLGNAERLPFADESFDVVFHVGGINFFNDRAQAIREMIRVARPGSKILIADETEEHVQAAYERGPITNFFYKKRKEPVTPPVDLVPKEMQDVHLEILNVIGKNRFYALSFRKPA